MTSKIITKIKSYDLNFNIGKLELDTLFELKKLSKNQILLKTDVICKYYYFVNIGALKVTYLNDGEVITSFFAFENYFFTEFESYATGKATKYEIVAIENCEILQISKPKMDFLFNKYPIWRFFLNKTQEETIIKLIDILHQFQTKSASNRYEELFKNPDFIQRAKQKDLSSMLGITKHSLSRIRKKK